MHVSSLRVCVGAAWVNSLQKTCSQSKTCVVHVRGAARCILSRVSLVGGTSRSGISRKPHSNTAVAS